MLALTLEDLHRIKQTSRRMMSLREGAARAKITVHMGTCGIAAGARDILATFLEEIEKKKVRDVIVTTSGCAGLCSREPMTTVQMTGQAPVKYVDLTVEKARQIFAQHVQGGEIVAQHALAVGSETTG